MKYRKIKKKERDNGWRYCTFCKLNGLKRIHAVNTNRYYDGLHREFACEEHTVNLRDTLHLKPVKSIEPADIKEYNSGDQATYEIKRLFGVDI